MKTILLLLALAGTAAAHEPWRHDCRQPAYYDPYGYYGQPYVPRYYAPALYQPSIYGFGYSVQYGVPNYPFVFAPEPAFYPNAYPYAW